MCANTGVTICADARGSKGSDGKVRIFQALLVLAHGNNHVLAPRRDLAAVCLGH